jgi:hypothetical protein
VKDESPLRGAELVLLVPDTGVEASGIVVEEV